MLTRFSIRDLEPICEAYASICEALTIPPNGDSVEDELRRALPQGYGHSDRIVRWFRNDRRRGASDAELRKTYVSNLANTLDLLRTYDSHVDALCRDRRESSVVSLDTPRGPMKFQAVGGLDRIRSLEGAKRFVKAVGDVAAASAATSTGSRRYAIGEGDLRNIGVFFVGKYASVWFTKTYGSTNKFVYHLWRNAETLGRGDAYGDPDEQTPYCTHSKEHWDEYSHGNPDYTQYWILKRTSETAAGDLGDAQVAGAFSSIGGRGAELLVAMDDTYGDLLDRNDDRITVDEVPEPYTEDARAFEMKLREEEIAEWLGEAARTGTLGGAPERIKINLTDVSIPDGVTSIGRAAFSNCRGLRRVTIPSSVTSIGNCAFWGCNGLTSVTIPDSVTSIGDWAFQDCSGLTSVTIPDSVTSIGEMAFSYCSGLTSVTIPDSVTSIGERAFSYCDNLKSVTIPKRFEDGIFQFGLTREVCRFY